MIKAEGQQRQDDSWVKPEPGLADEVVGSVPDEDIYEDAGDLDFSSGSRPVLLTRLPNFLWDSWNSLGEDEDIRIGMLRVEGPLHSPTRVRFSQIVELIVLIPEFLDELETFFRCCK